MGSPRTSTTPRPHTVLLPGPGSRSDLALVSSPEALTDALPAPSLLRRGLQAGFAPAFPAWIGPYRILEELGAGGMGTVLLGEQREPLRRKVAIKLVRTAVSSREFLARFGTERRLLASMSHPGIARLLDAGSTEDDRPWFAMEFVAGEPITRVCVERSLDTRARLGLFVALCDAVAHAHRRGVVHRDLKPSNVLVQEVDDRLEVKVIDFGLAKTVDSQSAVDAAHTAYPAALGTPDYMSPEQASGRTARADARADVYALGVLLHELLHEALPGEGPRRRVDPDLDAIIGRSLSRNAGARYPTARELGADVRRHLDHRPVEARAPGCAYRLRRFVRRQRAWFAGAACATALLLPLLVISLDLYRAADREAARALEAGAQAENQLELARALGARRERELDRLRADLRLAVERLAEPGRR